MERMPETNDPVERFIALIREIDPRYMTDLFQQGACYHLFLILRDRWPDAEPWYAPYEGHVYTRIAGRWYDIRGRKRRPSRRHFAIMSAHEQEEARGWLPHRIANEYRIPLRRSVDCCAAKM